MAAVLRSTQSLFGHVAEHQPETNWTSSAWRASHTARGWRLGRAGKILSGLRHSAFYRERNPLRLLRDWMIAGTTRSCLFIAYIGTSSVPIAISVTMSSIELHMFFLGCPRHGSALSTGTAFQLRTAGATRCSFGKSLPASLAVALASSHPALPVGQNCTQYAAMLLARCTRVTLAREEDRPGGDARQV